jgi:hypothetical protein
MANEIIIPKTHLILGLSLPLAVLLGYFVAEPVELGSMAVVAFVLAVLSIPLMMKWHYPLLVFCWNAALCPAFLPGRLPFWALLAFVGLLFAVLNRAVSPNARFVVEPSITKALLALTAVVVVTGMITGGFGVQMLGADHYGGKHYFYFMAAVAGYFVFTSRRIPPHQAGFYVALFFLSGLTYGLSELATRAGPGFEYMLWFLAQGNPGSPDVLTGSLGSSLNSVRMYGLGLFGMAAYGYLLARFGIRGVLDLTRPWRLLLVLLALVTGMLSGFRSFALLSGLIFVMLFYLEGLHRTRYLPALLGFFILGSVVVLPQAEKLPLMVQRSLSFLPGKFNWVARESAEGSWQWRVEMWKVVLPEVPQHLLRGKGWTFDARDFFTAVETGEAGNPLAGTILVGDFHNGPLSILIPFGIYGAIAFGWFLTAGLRVLHRNWKSGNPALQKVNALLLAAFAGQTFFFFFCFGSLYSDMAIFTGILGLGVALNGAGAPVAQAAQPTADLELSTEYIKV